MILPTHTYSNHLRGDFRGGDGRRRFASSRAYLRFSGTLTRY
jgi:hypothetical protein